MSAPPVPHEAGPPAAVPWIFAGGVPDDRTVEALASHGGMILLPAPADVVRYVNELSAALGSDLAGYGSPDTQAAAPEPLALTLPDGRTLVHTFTTSDAARAFAVSSGLMGPTDTLTYLTRPWTGGLRHLLASGAAGIVVDDGSPQRVECDRRTMAALLAGLDRERLARDATIHVVVSDGSAFVERDPDGLVHGFVYDCDQSADQITRRMLEHRSKLGVATRSTQAVLLEFFEAGVSRLDVNRWLPDARGYDRRDIERLLRSARDAEAARASARTDTSASPAAPAPEAPPATGLGRARRNEPTLLAKAAAQGAMPPVPPRHADDAASTAFFRQWQKKVVGKQVPSWRFVEAITHEGTLWAPRASAPADGLAWPVHVAFTDSDTGLTTSAVALYSSEATARRGLASGLGTASRVEKLSAVEAFRWLWACPLGAEQVLIDYGDEEGWIAFPIAWVRDGLYPLCHDLGDLGGVPRVAPGRLGQLNGVHALRPEVVRSFVAGWRTLVEPPATGGGLPVTVEHEGRRLLPVFSDAEGFFGFQSQRGGQSFTPAPAGAIPPFRRWLTAGPDIEGIVLDPGSRAPLVVGAAALAVFDACCDAGHYPMGPALVDRIGPLARAGSLQASALALVLAEIPVYWFDASARRKGGFSLLHVPNDPDTGVLFTSEDRARLYITANADAIDRQAMREASSGSTMTAYGWPQQWATSPWVLMADNFEVVAVDPEPDGSGGIRASGDVVRLVLDALNARLRPRVADFVWT